MSAEPVRRSSGEGGADGPRAPESYTWPLVALVVVILPQVLVPARDRVGPPLLVPIVETAVLLIMLIIAAKPGPVPRHARPVVLFLFGVLIVANAAAAIRLVVLVLDGGKVDGVALTANRLLIAGTLLLATNVITFGLLYWQLDRDGPAGRAVDPTPYPDFQFPQTGTTGLAAPGWRPRFPDYLYLAYTNIVALSPTDTMPLTSRAKALMALQSLISLAVLVVVLARVINILPT
ncbi:MAG TPA: hypothetical protein VE441_07085 [Mycobacterium sp.]|jgi:uncharacterized membrane protein|nr:hypothetical protein [Mycobacterium sp.]